MTTINELMEGKQPGEISLRESNCPESSTQSPGRRMKDELQIAAIVIANVLVLAFLLRGHL